MYLGKAGWCFSITEYASGLSFKSRRNLQIIGKAGGCKPELRASSVDSCSLVLVVAALKSGSNCTWCCQFQLSKLLGWSLNRLSRTRRLPQSAPNHSYQFTATRRTEEKLRFRVGCYVHWTLRGALCGSRWTAIRDWYVQFHCWEVWNRWILFLSTTFSQVCRRWASKLVFASSGLTCTNLKHADCGSLR